MNKVRSKGASGRPVRSGVMGVVVSVAGAGVVLGGMLVTSVLGQAETSQGNARPDPATAARAIQLAQANPPAPAQQQQPQRAPVRSETTPFDNWTMTCQEALPAAGAKAGKKTCWATMRVSDAKSQQVVLVWLIGRDAKDVPTISLQTPTGVLVRDGVDVAIGQTVRKLPYQACDQNGCEASGPYDAAFAKDLAAAKEATVSFKARDGRQIAVKVSVSGADKLLAALPK